LIAERCCSSEGGDGKEKKLTNAGRRSILVEKSVQGICVGGDLGRFITAGPAKRWQMKRKNGKATPPA